jgi:dTDP-3-amino-2,3,6-trideoxy-4-keto-D-glucose/dTDP-3-amino-3,4,6-trideoxy-alpha-D-glucose/dTDP-2,6-dideoxy-D-kanosamine transaminase
MSSSALDDLLNNTPARCVVVTHLYGLLADMDSILAVCAARQVPVIEDCAQSHGATREQRRAGSFGVAGCFSFYPTKNLGALGDGGAVVTRDDGIAGRILELRQYGWEAKYQVVHLGGRNSRLDEIQAAILTAKLPHLDEWNRARRYVANRYSTEIAHANIKCPPVLGEDHAAHLYVVRCSDRPGLRQYLESKNISTDIHYPISDHRQPCFSTMPILAELPHTDRATAEVLTLPCFPEMTNAEVDAVVEALNSW